jgi:hypothetical protein
MVPRSSLLEQDQLVPSTAPLTCGPRSGSPATGEEQLGTVRSFLCSRIIGDTDHRIFPMLRQRVEAIGALRRSSLRGRRMAYDTAQRDDAHTNSAPGKR